MTTPWAHLPNGARIDGVLDRTRQAPRLWQHADILPPDAAQDPSVTLHELLFVKHRCFTLPAHLHALDAAHVAIRQLGRQDLLKQLHKAVDKCMVQAQWYDPTETLKINNWSTHQLRASTVRRTWEPLVKPLVRNSVTYLLARDAAPDPHDRLWAPAHAALVNNPPAKVGRLL